MAGYCRYKRLKKQVSYDSGATWQDVSPAEYMKGDLIEADSNLCGYAVYTRWVESGYTCVGYDKHAVEYEQTSNDNINWTYTQRSRTGRLLEANSEDCGYTPPTPQYRTISGVPYCTGYDKMVDTQYQVSYDSGSTWSTVSSSTLTVEHNSQDCGYTPPTPPSSGYANQYLTFRALESGKFSFTKSGMSYSLDSGSTWNTLSANAFTPTVQSGDTVMWKSELIARNSDGIGRFSFTHSGTGSSKKKFEVEGNIMSLKYGDNFSGQTTLHDSYSFSFLFYSCGRLTNAENLILPATTLSESCYAAMFDLCTSLTAAPELPATTLASNCYDGMFMGCTSLTTSPVLPATTLADSCYYHMFYDCTSLTTAPNLPATTLSSACYAYMFSGCTSLTTAPVLSATTLASSCYDSMFISCSSLTTAPILPATTLTPYCYYSMFYGCTSLTTAPTLPATTLTEGCYKRMFSSCSSLTTAPTLPATTLANYCYDNMFSNCTNLSSVTCLATNISATYCTDYWLYNVARSGTFTKAASMSNWPTGDSGIPSGWTVLNNS